MEKIYYHGTNVDFDEFEIKESLREDFLGQEYKVECSVFFFTENKETARVFAKNRSDIFGGKPTIKECNLDFKNPLDLTGSFYYERYKNMNSCCVDIENNAPVLGRFASDEELEIMNNNSSYIKLCKILGVDLEEYGAAGYTEVKLTRGPLKKKYEYNKRELLILLDESDIVKNIIKNGYDSAICNEGSFLDYELGMSVAVFSQEQIKIKQEIKQENKIKKNKI